MKNKAVLKLNQKPHSGYGIISFILAIVSLIITLIAINMSAFIDPLTRNQQILIGVLGWISGMMTLFGFCLAIIAEGTDDYEKIFAHISLSLHFIGLIYHVVVIYVGFF